MRVGANIGQMGQLKTGKRKSANGTDQQVCGQNLRLKLIYSFLPKSKVTCSYCLPAKLVNLGAYQQNEWQMDITRYE